MHILGLRGVGNDKTCTLLKSFRENCPCSLTGGFVQDVLKRRPLIFYTLPLQDRPQIIYFKVDEVSLHQVQHAEDPPGLSKITLNKN